VLIYAAFAMSILSICNVKKPIARVCAHKNDIDGCNSCNKILVIDDSLKIKLLSFVGQFDAAYSLQ